MILTNFKVNVNERVGEMLRFVKIPHFNLQVPFQDLRYLARCF